MCNSVFLPLSKTSNDPTRYKIVSYGVLFLTKQHAVPFFIVLYAVGKTNNQTDQVIFARWSKRDVAIGRETKAHQIAATATSVGYSVGFSFFM